MRKFVAILAVALAVAACADDGSADTTTTGGAAPSTAGDTAAPDTTAPATTAPATTAAAGPAATINISGSAFGSSPTVSVGDEVEVTNNDSIPHTWTSTDDVFDSGSLGQGESFSFTFDEPGEYPFVCVIHPAMTGTVTVEG